MHTPSLVPSRFGAALAAGLALALAGCGGGGSDGGSASPDAAASGDAIDKYRASFLSRCQAEPSVTDTATQAALNVRRTIKALAKSSATRTAVEVTYTYYAAADCSGAARYTLTLSGNEFWLAVDGSSTVGGASADKVTLNQGNKLPGLSAANITLNGVRFPSAYVMPSATKDLWRLSGSDLFVGDTQALDAQGYPAALQATAAYQKQ